VIHACQAGTDVEMAKSAFASILESSVQRAAVAQNIVMEYAAKQSKAGIDAVKAQPGIAGTEAEELAERIQSGSDAAVAAQQQIMGTASQQMKAAAAKA
jgi:hypothetical protein